MECFENRIILSSEESQMFLHNLSNPNIETTMNLDRTLTWIDDHMKIQETNHGFSVEVEEGS